MEKRVTITVFLPAGVCGCSQTTFLSRVYEAIRNHLDEVEYRECSADSEAAREAGVSYRGVLVGNILLGPNPTVAEIEAAIVKQTQS
ncbi:MAG: hypothetical protein QXS20_07185 [Candidatus Thorarchaeota archaeon]